MTTTVVATAVFDSIPRWLEETRVPGAAVAVLEGGRVTAQRAFGVNNANVPLTRDALWNVASLTKPVVALTALRLVDAGALALDASLDPYWVDPDLQRDARHSQLTARLILTHRTGFPNWRWQLPGERLAFVSAPGTKLGYSGEGFEYLRRSLEALSARTIQQLSDSLVFAPLGMRETTYGWNLVADERRFVMGHDTAGAPVAVTKRPMSSPSGADWLVTTLDDYSRFGAWVLQQRALSPALFAEMTRAQVPFEGKSNESMGLGWEVMTGPASDRTILLHTGSDPGIKTLIVLLPGSRRGMVIFANGDNGMTLVLRILKAHLALKELTG